jgi:glycyl-tRNA synthetase beta subunit
VESLKNVTFQKELGSYYWKTAEIGGVVHWLHFEELEWF